MGEGTEWVGGRWWEVGGSHSAARARGSAQAGLPLVATAFDIALAVALLGDRLPVAIHYCPIYG